MLFSIPLEGEWAFALDPDAKGEAAGWTAADLTDAMALPGSVDLAAKTPLTTSRTMSFLSRRHPYVGRAWYARSFEVPAGAEDHFYTIALERPHGEVNIWLNGYKLGRDESLSTAVRMFAGRLKPGRQEIVMMIDNSRFEAVGEAIIRDNAMMGDVAHSKTDHTQTNWNGVVGYLRVEAARASVTRVDVYAPDPDDVTVKVELDAFDPDIRFPQWWGGDHAHQLVYRFTLADGAVVEKVTDLTIDNAFARHTLTTALPGAALWDEFSPVVHSLTVEWRHGGRILDSRTTDFGIRSFRAEGRHIKLNGRNVFLRGTLECAIFPLTGHPPTDHAGWEKVFKTAQAYGLNHIRYHSWCPPKAAFEVADRLGLLLHIETPVWPVLGADPALDRYIHAEADRILRDYGNHPSFVMLCVGNEVNGAGLHAFLERMMEKWRAADDRRIYTGGSGWPTISRADYISKPEPRSQRWNENLAGRLNARALETRTDWSEWVQSVPMALVSHEIGQWCVFPDLQEIAKYTGALEARNFEMVRDSLNAAGLGHLAQDYLLASGALQTQLYKEDIEAALRTRDMAGIQLLGLQDFSGQGTALIGVVDAFWDEKPYVTPAQFREFTAPVVPLVRADGFVATEGQDWRADVQLSQFGPADLTAARIDWALIGADGAVARSGGFDAGDLATGQLHDIGALVVDTAGLATARYDLVVSVAGTDYRNRWGLWVMPAAAATVETAGALDAATLARIEAGATVIFAPAPDAMQPNAALGHSAAFWNTLWTQGQEPHTLGLLIDRDHPALAGFPSASHSDWHWWEVTFGRRALDMAGLPARAIIRVVDDWNANRDLTILSELRVGKGRLILSAADLTADLGNRPVVRALAGSLAGYVGGPGAEAPAVSADQVAAWWEGVRA